MEEKNHQEQIDKILEQVSSEKVIQEVIKITTERRHNKAPEALEKASYVQEQYAMAIFPCGEIEVAETSEITHSELWRIHQKKHREKGTRLDSKMISGEIFILKGTRVKFAKTDIEIDNETIEELRKKGFIPLRPDFRVYS